MRLGRRTSARTFFLLSVLLFLGTLGKRLWPRIARRVSRLFQRRRARRSRSSGSKDFAVLSDPDGFLEFYECAESEDARCRLEVRTRQRSACLSKIDEKVATLYMDDGALEDACVKHLLECGSPLAESKRLRRATTADLVSGTVVRRTQQAWSDMLDTSTDEPLKATFAEGCSEFDEYLAVAARRMLRAQGGNQDVTVRQLLKALEFRVSDRKVLESLGCDVRCDLRLIGHDLKMRPVLYMCALSQEEPLWKLRDQILVVLETACRMSGEQGTLHLIFDMFGFQPELNSDGHDLEAMRDVLCSLFANRIFLITVVDFSRVAQVCWWSVKPLLPDTTRQKVYFVTCAEARDMAWKKLEAATAKRLCLSFDVNRDAGSSCADRKRVASATRVGQNWVADSEVSQSVA